MTGIWNARNRAAAHFATLLGLVVYCIAAQLPAAAHELRPTIISAEIGAGGRVEIDASLNLEALVAGIGPGHETTGQAPQSDDYDRLRGLSPEALAQAFVPIRGTLTASFGLATGSQRVPVELTGIAIPVTGDTALARISTISLAASLPNGTREISIMPPAVLGEAAIRVSMAGEPRPFFSALLGPGETAGPIDLGNGAEQGFAGTLASYVAIGFEHIVPLGLDHILFVVGLFLLSPYVRPLLWQVTGFTLAHSVTLALGTFGLVRVSPTIVEPLIAASIVFIAVENLFTDRLQRWRPAVVFGFGLLHGLGFAGVLAEFGLPPGQYVAALLGFNIGVELGQLAVIAVCFLTVGLWFRGRGWYRRRISLPASAAVATIAAVWLVERIG